MGWCSGTGIFDAMASVLLDGQEHDKKAVLKSLWDILEDSDWDCQSESVYYDHPLVQEIIHELHPDWDDD